MRDIKKVNYLHMVDYMFYFVEILEEKGFIDKKTGRVKIVD